MNKPVKKNSGWEYRGVLIVKLNGSSAYRHGRSDRAAGYKFSVDRQARSLTVSTLKAAIAHIDSVLAA